MAIIRSRSSKTTPPTAPPIAGAISGLPEVVTVGEVGGVVVEVRVVAA